MREIKVKPSTVHPAENDTRLPEVIRGGHYIHFSHFCAVMGCEHAPYCEIEKQFGHLGKIVNPFPILHKDEYVKIENIIKADALLAEREYQIFNICVASLLAIYNKSQSFLLYGNSKDSGYPIAEVLQAVAYIIATDNELKGKRPREGYISIIERHLSHKNNLCVEFRKPELLTPLVIVGNGRGALVGAQNPDVYSRLISISPENEYKLLVRQITKEDLQNAQ